MKKGFDRFDLDEFECKLIELQSNYNNKLYINSKDKDYYKEVIKNYKNIDDDISEKDFIEFSKRNK